MSVIVEAVRVHEDALKVIILTMKVLVEAQRVILRLRQCLSYYRCFEFGWQP